MTSETPGRRFCGRGAALLLCAGLWGCGDRSEDDPGFSETERALSSVLATLAAGEGGLQVKRSQLAFWEPAAVGTTFMPGDWVQSGPGAFARIEFLPGGRLEVDASAIVVVDAQAVERPGGERVAEAVLAVETGIVRGVLREPGQTVGIRAADGTTARLRARDEGPVEYRLAKRPRGTEVAIQEGVAVLSAAKTSHVLSGGQATDVAEEALGSVVQLLSPPALLRPAAEATVRVAPGAPVRLEWEEVRGATAYRIQLSPRADFRHGAKTFETAVPHFAHTPERPGAWFWRLSTRDADGRWGLNGPARRVVVVRPAEVELLRTPVGGARLSLPDGEPVAFGWGEAPEGGYRLVIARGDDLEGAAVVDEVTLNTTAEVPLPPGDYTWGVYAVADEDAARPLFVEPRRLRVRRTLRVEDSEVETPRSIKRWGK